MRNQFTTKRPVLLIGAGEVVPEIFKAEAEASDIIAADGGVNWLEARGIEPSWALGDGDSIAKNARYLRENRFLHIAEQDTTDFEKALSRIHAPSVIGLGFLGDRLDHALAALHVLAKLSSRTMLIGVSEAVVVIKQANCRLRLPVGARVSIIPLGTVHFVSSQGLKYPLDGLSMAFGDMIGSSNETDAEVMSIQLKPKDNHEAGYVLMVDTQHYKHLRERQILS